ncbi:uncharacterized protein EI97DRAFT_324995 [Westerdykella ornata]|uniref:Uncharacterized protein n=1 Tax=Westerdykella ornata TaxID=318751 RepID=A0A6A6JK74_WESOR|nr:uncharacterized protein EI97DRAFT_324995 [Westerdykella ornata]KAF2276907.1 hypothetical protein EI97DRAFT_324995 [Westerdykella ornata]
MSVEVDRGWSFQERIGYRASKMEACFDVEGLSMYNGAAECRTGSWSGVTGFQHLASCSRAYTESLSGVKMPIQAGNFLTHKFDAAGVLNLASLFDQRSLDSVTLNSRLLGWVSTRKGRLRIQAPDFKNSSFTPPLSYPSSLKTSNSYPRVLSSIANTRTTFPPFFADLKGRGFPATISFTPSHLAIPGHSSQHFPATTEGPDHAAPVTPSPRTLNRTETHVLFARNPNSDIDPGVLKSINAALPTFRYSRPTTTLEPQRSIPIRPLKAFPLPFP